MKSYQSLFPPHILHIWKNSRSELITKQGKALWHLKLFVFLSAYKRFEKGCRDGHLRTGRIQVKLCAFLNTTGTNLIISVPEKKQLVESLYWIITYVKKKKKIAKTR